MENRLRDLSEIRQFTESVETELTMILQSLQWDQNTLVEKPALETCKFDPGHKVRPGSKISHESQCYLHCHGYSAKDSFLPDALEIAGNSLVKLNNEQLEAIINKAAQIDPLFKKGAGRSAGPDPLTLDRLQCTYTSDERRAIHDAVVQAAPSLHDLSDLALPISGTSTAKELRKTRLEVLAELRDVKRRRTKYRVAATNNYSHVLSELIKTQMEFFTASVGVKNKGAIDEPNRNTKVESNVMVDNNNKKMQRLETTQQNKFESHDLQHRIKNRYDHDESQNSKKSRTDDDQQYKRRRLHDDPHNSKKRRFHKESEYKSSKSYVETKEVRERISDLRVKDKRYVEDSMSHRKRCEVETSYNRYFDKKSHTHQSDYRDASRERSYYRGKHLDKYDQHGRTSTDRSYKSIPDDRDREKSTHKSKHKKHC